MNSQSALALMHVIWLLIGARHMVLWWRGKEQKNIKINILNYWSNSRSTTKQVFNEICTIGSCLPDIFSEHLWRLKHTVALFKHYWWENPFQWISPLARVINIFGELERFIYNNVFLKQILEKEFWIFM